MTQLIWDDTGKRLFETGLDRCALYVMDETGEYPLGVAWNGLISLTEAPSGAEPSPLYGDNIKYLTLVSSEDFAATLEAYTYPEEFEECDGSTEISLDTGGKVSQQARKKFGLVYRTKIGNDVAGTTLGYKLHLVYGCLASPSEKAFSTINDSPEAITFSWEISTTPSNITGFQPTSLIVVDSTKCIEEGLALLEKQLFGDDETVPNLPLPDIVKTILSNPWLEVVPPSGWLWELPFTIEQRDGIFRPDSAFDLQAYAESQMTNRGTATYYVSPDGADGNDGLTWETAYRSVWNAFDNADVGTVYIAAGYYYRSNSTAGSAPAKDCVVIGVGDVYLTSDEYNQTGSWSQVSNHYEAANSRTIEQCYDSTNPDADGNWGLMIKCATSGEVDSTPNSWYKSGSGTIYLRTWDDRAPDSNLRLMPTTSGGVGINSAADQTLYIKNLKICGGRSNEYMVSASPTANINKFYIEDCDFGYSYGDTSQYNAFSVWGMTEFIIFNSIVRNSMYFDGLNYKIYGGVIPKAIEYNVESYKHGDGSTDQPSTSHDGVTIVRIMGKYHDCPGLTGLADVGGGKSWNLGCEIYDPQTSYSGGAIYGDTAVDIWCDQVNIHDIVSGYDLAVDATATILHHEITSGGSFSDGGGGISTYNAEYRIPGT